MSRYSPNQIYCLLPTLVILAVLFLTPNLAGAAGAAGQPKTKLSPPLEQAFRRVTLKPFGIYVSPRRSPVSPERFIGYHTGVDFETWPNEKDKPVTVQTICTGRLLRKSWVKGYGGVAVQACSLENKPVTIIYGHLKLSSITAKVGKSLAVGSKLAILGTGFSTETDGERKHLHLGIHRGQSFDLRGYVQKASELKQWLDITKYLK